MHEADPTKGGQSWEAQKADIRSARLSKPQRDAIRAAAVSVTVWHRIADFQAVSLLQIAESMLLGSPAYEGKVSLPLVLPGSLSDQTLGFEAPVVLFVSNHNPGAHAAAREIMRDHPEAMRLTKRSPALVATDESQRSNVPRYAKWRRRRVDDSCGRATQSTTSEDAKLPQSDSVHLSEEASRSVASRVDAEESSIGADDSVAGESVDEESGADESVGGADLSSVSAFEGTGEAGGSRSTEEFSATPGSTSTRLKVKPLLWFKPRRRRLTGQGSQDEQQRPTHMLLYLSRHTFDSEHGGAALADEVRLARAANFPIVMCHENDAARDGCNFARFFATTPEDLIAAGLYSALAIPLMEGEDHRRVSIKLCAKAMGAIAVRRRTSASESYQARLQESARKISRLSVRVSHRSSRALALPRSSQRESRSLSTIASAGSEPAPAPDLPPAPTGEATAPAAGESATPHVARRKMHLPRWPWASAPRAASRPAASPLPSVQ